jgi:hypothetical protein
MNLNSNRKHNKEKVSMNQRVLKNITVLIMILSFLSSCATMQGIVGKKPQNSVERDIFTQAIAASAVIGGVAGGVMGAAASGKNKKENALIGAGVGALLGGVVGGAVANHQIENYRNIQLKNDQLETLLDSARQYNQRVAAYNNRLEQQMIRLRKKNKEERARIAMAKKQQAEVYKTQLQEAIAERMKLSEALVSGQKEQYQQTLRELKIEEQKLIATITELEDIYEQARIG